MSATKKEEDETVEETVEITELPADVPRSEKALHFARNARESVSKSDLIRQKILSRPSAMPWADLRKQIADVKRSEIATQSTIAKRIDQRKTRRRELLSETQKELRRIQRTLERIASQTSSTFRSAFPKPAVDESEKDSTSLTPLEQEHLRTRRFQNRVKLLAEGILTETDNKVNADMKASLVRLLALNIQLTDLLFATEFEHTQQFQDLQKAFTEYKDREESCLGLSLELNKSLLVRLARPAGQQNFRDDPMPHSGQEIYPSVFRL